MSFDSLGLSEPLLRAISAANYTTPTPIQRQAIPPIASGRDVLGCAQTGTGKTAAFAIPLIQQLDKTRKASAGKQPPRHGGRLAKVLVLAPTRELAVQINASFCKYAKRTKLRTVVIYGGVSQRPQTDALRRGVDVIVATPGRLLDLMNQGYVDLCCVHTVVLDEADHMLDMGFLPDVKKILGQLPKQRQTLLFSATMPPDIRKLAEQNMVDPVRVTIKVQKSEAAKINQSVYFVPPSSKSSFLLQFLKTQPRGTALVFSRTKRNADRVTERLVKAGIRAEAIHSNKTQNKRQRTLDAFRSGRVDVLVATDIAARGIDVQNITYVINYDLPDVAETYTHRIGRTGRAGQTGIAITLCEANNKKGLRQIEQHLGYRIEVGSCLPELTEERGHGHHQSLETIVNPNQPNSARRAAQQPSGRGSGQSRGGGHRRQRGKPGSNKRSSTKPKNALPQATSPAAIVPSSAGMAPPSIVQPEAAAAAEQRKPRAKRPGKNARLRKRAALAMVSS